MRPHLPVLLLFPSCPSCSLPFRHYPDSCLPVPYFYLPVITQFPSCPFFPLYFTCPSFLRFPACPSLTLPFRHYQISCLPARLLLYLPVLYLPRPVPFIPFFLFFVFFTVAFFFRCWCRANRSCTRIVA